MAAESAVILARLLAESPPSEELFQRYAAVRRPRTDLVTNTSRRIINSMSGSGLWGILRNLAVTLFGGMLIRSGMMGHVAYDAGTAAL